VQVALVGYCAAGPLVGLTGSLAGLLGALFIWGAFQGTLDVAMNTQAIAVERARGRLLMSGLHGSWSIGSFAGAGIGALAVAAGRAGPAAPAHRVPRRRYPQLARTPCPCPRRMKAAITRSYAGGCHTHPGKMWFREC
jgi:hypothetical protein